MAVAPTDAADRLWRGQPGYEQARTAGWNRRVAARFPDVIVRPATDGGVAEAVRWARSLSLRVAVRAGGHSMCGASLHDGGMLLDLSLLRGVAVDSASGACSVQPAVTARGLAAALAEHGLAFPVAHHGSVPLSGFVLSGGLGWNLAGWGPACASLRSVEVVTAGGDRAAAAERHHAGLLWAARGAGAAFPAIATRFHLSAQPLPAAIRTSLVLYPLAEVETVGRWAAELAGDLPRHVELLLLLAAAPPGSAAGPARRVVGVIATAFAGSAAEASRWLSVVESCPAAPRALRCDLDQPASFDSLFAAIGGLLPAGHRFCEESLWSREDAGSVLPPLAEEIVGAPSARSLILVAPVASPGPGRPGLDAAFSPMGRTFALCYGIWSDPADDAANRAWLDALVERALPLTAGRYVAETDAAGDPTRLAGAFGPGALSRLLELRTRYDPDGALHTWLEALPAAHGAAAGHAQGGIS